MEEPREEPPAQAEFKLLDPRVISLWRVTNSIWSAVLVVGSFLLASFSALARPASAPWVFALCGLVIALCVWLVCFRPQRLYSSWGYRITGRVFETRSGRVFQVRRLLPLSRLQHVDLQRGPIERAYGLASLVLHTAGTHEASIRLPGLSGDEAVRLRDHLVELGGDDAV